MTGDWHKIRTDEYETAEAESFGAIAGWCYGNNEVPPKLTEVSGSGPRRTRAPKDRPRFSPPTSWSPWPPKETPMPRQWIIGRSPHADISVNDEYASPQHCVLVVDAGRVYVADLGSTNGTHIIRQGVRIKVSGPTPLAPGDALIVGRTSVPWQNAVAPIRVIAEVAKETDQP